MRKKFEAVAFDLDGTLYPDYRLNIRLIPFILRRPLLLLAFGRARVRLRLAGKAERKLTADDFYAEQAALVADLLGRPAQQVRGQIETLIYKGYEPFFKNIELFPGVVETLEEFRALGLKLGLLSDLPPAVKLEYLGMDSCWDAVLCSEQTGALKPDALPFIALAEALGTVPERVLFVGNSFRYDVVGAKKAGMSAALIKRSVFSTGLSNGPTEHGGGKESGIQADFIFSDYRQLRDYMVN